jgi:hypothetical protein
MASRLLTFLALAALAHSAVAFPHPAAPKPKKHFSVPARRARTLPLERRAAYGTAVADEHVVVDFLVGGQAIPVALDSGSSFFWTASTRATDADVLAELPAVFDPAASPTYRDEDDPADAYDCGNDRTACAMGLDTVEIPDTGLVAENMAFGVATRVGDGVFQSGQAATMGMGRQPGDASGE